MHLSFHTCHLVQKEYVHHRIGTLTTSLRACVALPVFCTQRMDWALMYVGDDELMKRLNNRPFIEFVANA